MCLLSAWRIPHEPAVHDGGIVDVVEDDKGQRASKDSKAHKEGHACMTCDKAFEECSDCEDWDEANHDLDAVLYSLPDGLPAGERLWKEDRIAQYKSGHTGNNNSGYL